MKIKFWLWLLLILCGSSSLIVCSHEDGLPDPPIQELVPCNPDAGDGDPLACPAAMDASVDAGADAGADAGGG